MEYTDVMLDLETLGNKSNSALLSIGAVEFNIETGETGREFYKVIDLQSCLDKGLIVNGSTFYWWMKKSDEARNAICEENVDLASALMAFNAWMHDCVQETNIWGNGARFDIGILEDAYVACGYQKMPWGFRFERDVRTLVSFAPHPIDDCKHQISYCHSIKKKLNTK